MGDARTPGAPGPPAGLPFVERQAHAMTTGLETEETEDSGDKEALREAERGRTRTGWGIEGMVTGAVRTLAAGIGTMWEKMTGKRGRGAERGTDNTIRTKRPRTGDG